MTDGEAYNLCKEELRKKPKKNKVFIWFIYKFCGSLQGRIYGYRRNSEVPFVRHLDVHSAIQGLEGLTGSWMLRFINMQPPRKVFVKRKNPHTLSELAFVATLDNCNEYCCLFNLITKIEELRIPPSQKEELKKLARGFKVILEEKTPNEFCIIHNNPMDESDEYSESLVDSDENSDSMDESDEHSDDEDMNVQE